MLWRTQARALRALHLNPIRTRAAKLLATTVAAGTLLYYSPRRQIHNDAAVPALNNAKTSTSPFTEVASQTGLSTLVWGSNRSNVLSLGVPPEEVIRTPTIAKWLDNVALRDLVFHRKHAACVDARGDVYQWGDEFFGDSASQCPKPKQTLKGKNIKKIQLTESKLYALSHSGQLYVLSSVMSEQLLPETPVPASSPWWRAQWFNGGSDSVDFAEVVPKEKLIRGERITSITTGINHLLAITNKGRTFVHPIDKKANQYGQLGMRSVQVQHVSGSKNAGLVDVDMAPKSFAEQTGSIADDRSIRFCPYLFELPVLKEIQIEQVAAGGRNSFARTKTGQVLAWGANDYGQLGLGSRVTLDVIVVPTEVNFWRSTPTNSRSKCIDISVGGDLTSFTVERTNESQTPSVDLLMCGNGQWGGLGNNAYSTAQGMPVKARNVSGLVEYNDAGKLQPITPHSIAVSPSGHVLLTLETTREGLEVGGRDLVVWGKNMDGELGTGKKSGVAAPTTLEGSDGERVMLRKRKAEVRDMEGRVWGREVSVEQRACVGIGSSSVYWRVD
ncbi:hypothetical protein AMATHDRAFT_140044 [Amanita thiersii Skay4041]|uniref:Uncharacterized protein n=1 Tax=Amanita thiersii Skay4041 TaxID=703135 RepID=A0A2A9NXC1_9AGAR|nr:hypothetical protein AMATHDRAFT_140044 [Amanita thiersii Skay4041]